MKKAIKILFIAAVQLVTITVSHGQIYVMENENTLRENNPEVINNWPVNPQYTEGYDNYTPIGEGVFLLALLAGAYGLNKKKERESGK